MRSGGGHLRPRGAAAQGVGDVISGRPSHAGFYDAVDVRCSSSWLGGFLGVVMKTGAIDAGLSNVIRILGGREILLKSRDDGPLHRLGHVLRMSGGDHGLSTPF